MNAPKKVVLAYSGGLDTSIILKWLQTEYGCEVVTFTADLGQGEEVEPARRKAELLGKDIAQHAALLHLHRAQRHQIARHRRLGRCMAHRPQPLGQFLLAGMRLRADQLGQRSQSSGPGVGHASIHASAARAVCMRFSACRHTPERGPSITAASTSSPRRAGRQCRNQASSVSAISASST